jgi:hypothetical protein
VGMDWSRNVTAWLKQADVSLVEIIGAGVVGALR